MAKIFYDKTDKGRDEISSRKYQLSPKLRPLLVMIDGKHSSDELLKRLAAVGLDRSHLDELLKAGFIEQVAITDDTPAPNPQVSNTNSPPTITEAPKPEQVNPISTVASKAEAVQALRQFFNDSIKAHLGLRGFTMQLRVERADTLVDFSALGDDFIEALYKSKGQQLARTVEARMQQLLQQATQFES